MFKKPYIEIVSPKQFWADNLDEIIVPCIKNTPKEYKEIKPWHGLNVKQRIERLFESQTQAMDKTIKQCDGIIKLWQKSFLLKFPCDTIIDIKKDTGWRYSTSNSIFNIGGHSKQQYGKMMPDTWTVKFTYNLFLNNNIDILPMSPIYHKKQPYEVLPGIIFQRHRSPSILNIIAAFPNITESYLFKKGDPLCILYTGASVKLKSKFDSTAELIMPTF